MAPLNGAAGKPAKTAARRTASKPVVPVLPLNYPQHLPVAANSMSGPSTSSPLAHPNGQAPQDKNNLRDPHKPGETPAEQWRQHGQSSGRNVDAVVTSAAPVPPTLSPLASGTAVRAASDKITGMDKRRFVSTRTFSL